MQGSPQAPGTVSSPADPLPLPALRNASQQKGSPAQPNAPADNTVTIWISVFTETRVLAAFLGQRNDDPV